MKKARQILALLLTIAVSISFLSACNTNKGEQSNESHSSYQSDQNTTLGIMRDISSMSLVGEMKIGWNLGNTLDVCAADRDGDGKVNETPENGVVDETLWGNLPATQELFDKLKADGVNAVRIPVTWRDHLGKAPEYKIDAQWLDRVQEVVDYAYSIGMYVIINVHHDGGGDPAFGAWIRNASTDYDGVIEKYNAVWTQIADRFQNYSDYLIFESMNEVGFEDVDKSKAFTLLNDMNQEFVDLIRASGGNNEKRHLLIAGYWTDIAETCNKNFKMPNDPESRCILSLHYYTPWEFCTTSIQHTWGTDKELDVLFEKMGLVKTNFIDNGIPVIIGEYGTGGSNDTSSRIFFSEYVTKLCYDMGVPTFLWDNGWELKRDTLKWRTEGMIEALQRATSGDEYTVTKQ
ncbi:MAG TPA: glycoside hydrolase family 5 protein [Oscillospiraceae bacterium]|nr:glycoside hydrolase family 5 protein [Oscillospiraceae bacterium]